ncbi:MAG: hypothetical protein J3Q66DRAFT_420775 [Benniella sp.]|nr:MAG: hypothetical protein J3Q66DRAFT_420775 [Benniella sp.]
MTVYLFSSRSKARVFNPESSGPSIGLLHYIDSFHGTSEYLVLAKSSHDPKDVMTVDPRPDPAFQNPYPAASFRSEERGRQFVDRSEITREDCDRAFRSACEERLGQIVNDTVVFASNKKMLGGKSRAEFIKEQRDKVYQEQTGSNKKTKKGRIPRNTRELVVAILRKKHGKGEEFGVADMERIRRGASAGDNFDIWKKVVKSKFDGMWSAAVKDAERQKSLGAEKVKESSSAAGLGATIEEDPKDLRTCSATLKQLVSIMAHKVTLAIAAGDLYDKKAFGTFPKKVDIMTLLPEQFRIRDKVSTTINVAPIPVELQDKIELAQDKQTGTAAELDLAKLLSHEHLQYLQSTFLGKKGTTKDSRINHPVWERSVNAIKSSSDSLTKAPEGLNATITEAIGELATNISNLWNGAIFLKALDYLLRILLRLHLAPKRERKYQKRLHDQARKEEATSNEARVDRRALQRKLKKLCDDLSDVLGSGDDERVARRVPVLFELLSRARQQPPVPQNESETISQDRQEDASDNIRMDVDYGGLIFGDIPDDEDDPTGEPSRSRLMSLQAVLKMLIESSTVEGDIDEEDIREAGYSGSDFTTSECQVAAMIANTLGPYIPKRRPKPDTGIYLSRCTTGALGIYEVLCSATKNQFDVVNADGSPLTQQMQISQYSGNKRAIMGSFFDVKRIDEICQRHGLQFQYRITYVNQYTIRLLGNTIQNGKQIGEGPKQRAGHPVRSQLEERRKKQKGRPLGNKWAELSASLNVDKAQARLNAGANKAQMNQLENQVKSMRKELGTLQAEQTKARQEFNSNECLETYDALFQARVEVRDHRRELHGPDTVLKRLRKENYMWNKIATAPTSAQRTGSSAAVAMTTPTWERSTIEDDAKHTDISQLRQACT